MAPQERSQPESAFVASEDAPYRSVDRESIHHAEEHIASLTRSRVKENMVFDWLESVTVDAANPRNRGVTEDRRVMSRDGHLLRIIFYTDPQTGEKYEFLTNDPDLPPGVIVELLALESPDQKIPSSETAWKGRQSAGG